MRVGIKQVAERAGVSATTVSHVVNKTRYVSPEVEKRVNDAIKELNYTPNIMARGLRTNTVKTVAVIVQEASTPFFSRVVDEISDVLYKVKDDTPEAVLDAVKTDIDRFVGDAPQFDDITMLCLEYTKKMEDR